MFRRSSLKWPIILASLLLAITVSLLVLYILAQAANRQWGLLAVGTIFFALLLAGVVVYLVLTIKEINLNRRQANFIDSVTHELKSPIASIKLILQTLEFREVPPEQAREFHKYMLEDVQRLDSLIDHLLAAARLDQFDTLPDMEAVPLAPLLEQCAADIRRRYDLPADSIEMDVDDCVARGRPPELAVVFTNLLDNGVKYGGSPVKIRIDVRQRSNSRVLVRISDNGKGIRFELRSKVFQRFFRGGTELERTTKGTGLGLYLVKTLLRKMGGVISVHGRGPWHGATFEVDLPGGDRTVPSHVARGDDESDTPTAAAPLENASAE